MYVHILVHLKSIILNRPISLWRKAKGSYNKEDVSTIYVASISSKSCDCWLGLLTDSFQAKYDVKIWKWFSYSAYWIEKSFHFLDLMRCYNCIRFFSNISFQIMLDFLLLCFILSIVDLDHKFASNAVLLCIDPLWKESCILFHAFSSTCALVSVATIVCYFFWLYW